MYGKVKEHLCAALENLKQAGLYKEERIIESPQGAAIQVKGQEVLNFCANNYLGLSNNPRLIEGAKKMMDHRGFGMSSVRFICGTQDIHKELEAAISDYFHTEDTILYAACFDANGGLFGSFLTDEDAIISDALNHASIIDGVRLCKAKRYRYANANMEELEKCLQEAQAQRFRIICTDGVFSMDGNVAPMDKICDLAEKYDALVMVDESHSAGVVGATGHGVSELCNTYGRVDIYTGTLGKAFGVIGAAPAGIGIVAVDQAMKAAPVDIVWYGSPSHNLTMMNEFSAGISGDVSAVQKALEAGKQVGCELLRVCGITPISITKVHEVCGPDYVKENYTPTSCLKTDNTSDER